MSGPPGVPRGSPVDAGLEPIQTVAGRLRSAGLHAYVVGGAVRDLLMGRPPHDLDIVTEAVPERILELFPGAVPVGAAFGVVRVRVEDVEVDVATFRREGPYLDGRRPTFVEYGTLEEDVRRRDFTINGLLYDPLNGEVIDLVGGRADLAASIIRAIGDPPARFAEDRLRMLRAVRLAVELEFTIETGTLDAVRRQAHRITEVSGERIRDELLRMLVAPGRARGLVLLLDSGLLRTILPEVAAMGGVPQPPQFHPEGDVLTHTRLALSHLDAPSPVLALGVLLHDVGKPPTFERAADRIRFSAHDRVGAELAEAICRRLRLSGDETARVVSLVAEHQRFKDLPRMREANRKRFLARPDFADHLELHRVDCLASHRDLSTWAFANEAAAHLPEEDRRPTRLLTGLDLIALGYRPGPRFAAILEALMDAQLERRIRTRDEAVAFVRREFPSRGEERGRAELA